MDSVRSSRLAPSFINSNADSRGQVLRNRLSVVCSRHEGANQYEHVDPSNSSNDVCQAYGKRDAKEDDDDDVGACHSRTEAP